MKNCANTWSAPFLWIRLTTVLGQWCFDQFCHFITYTQVNAGVVLMIQRSTLKGMLNLVDVQTSALMTAPAQKDFVQERHLPMLYMPSVSITRLTVSDATQGVRSLLTCLVKNLVSSLHNLNYSITNSKVYSTSFVTLIYRESGLFLLHETAS